MKSVGCAKITETPQRRAIMFITDAIYKDVTITINLKLNVALSENASRTRYTIKIKLKLRKWVLKKKSFQLSFERREWAGRSVN